MNSPLQFEPICVSELPAFSSVDQNHAEKGKAGEDRKQKRVRKVAVGQQMQQGPKGKYLVAEILMV